MTAPQFRAGDAHTGEVADGPINFPALMPDAIEIASLRADIATLTEQRDDARAEVDNLTGLLKASGNHVANLSSGVAQYQADRDEQRERADEWQDRYQEAEIRIQELTGDRAGVSAVAR